MYPGNHAEAQPDKLAVVRPATGETLTYRQLDDRSNQLAQVLHATGLRRGCHVALFTENSLAFFEVLWACLRSGLYITPINRHLSAAEAAYIVEDCDAEVLIASAVLDQTGELGRLASGCRLKLAIGGAAEGFTSYEMARDAAPARQLEREWLGSPMVYSSGTTGRPKGVLRPLLDRAPDQGNPSVKNLIGVFGLDTESVYLAPAPLYHAAPVAYSMAIGQVGATLVVMDKFDAETALRLIQDHWVTHSQWVPTMFVRLLKLPEEVRCRYDLSSHRSAIHAAAPCPIEVKRRMIDWWGPILVEYYTSTEAVTFTVITSPEWLDRPGSVGRATGKPIHICDDEGRELAAGEPGLIYSEPPQGSGFAYHKAADKTGASSHPQQPGWMTVGDVGYMDEKGYLYLTDRKAFMIICGGVNIYPQQIEDALALHPKVADVAVIGVPNAELGEEVKAVVEPAAGVQPCEALAEEIKVFVQGKLGKQLTPRTVDFTDALPRLPTGKLYKKALRDRYWGEAGATVSLAARS